MICENRKTVYVVSAPLCFPEGFTIGSSGEGNDLEIERDGAGNPVLRGSSVAGLLRSATAASPFAPFTDRWFGKALDTGGERQESCLSFSDTAFADLSASSTHNLMCRHTGSVSEVDKGLFTVERCAPGVEGTLFFTLTPRPGEEDPEQEAAFLDFLLSLLDGGLLVGGSSNRGGGRCCLKDGKVYLKKFDLSQTGDAAEFLDLVYDRKDLAPQYEVKPFLKNDLFAVKVTLTIPAGQDILPAEGVEMFPAAVEKADGQTFWKIPGSTLRGVFKNWFSRLAAREGKKLVDSAQAYREQGPRKAVDMEDDGEDVILSLFGSLKRKGRLHISDAFSTRPAAPERDAQYRCHVAIDRFTGGTNDGNLFFDSVLSNGVTFETVISIAAARNEEIGYLEQTLRALHLGILRIGSSKAAGRLAVKACQVLSNPSGAGFAPIIEGVEK